MIKISVIACSFTLVIPFNLEAIVINDLESGDHKAASLVDSQRSPDFPYWEHVGMVGMGSGIYLGDGYVLTSAHVGCHPFRTSNGTAYRPEYRSWRVLTNPDGGASDLAVFRVSIPAGDTGLAKLGSLPIGETSRTDMAGPLVMIGTGHVEKHIPAAHTGPSVTLGYEIVAHREKRLGINSLDKVIEKPVATPGGYRTRCFASNFDPKHGEAQATAGDSGGASFAYNSKHGRWELVGCIIAASQLQDYVPFGARTYLGDIGSYRDQLPAVAADTESPAPTESVQSVAVVASLDHEEPDDHAAGEDTSVISSFDTSVISAFAKESLATAALSPETTLTLPES